MNDLYWSVAAVLGAPLPPVNLAETLRSQPADAMIAALTQNPIFRRRVYEPVLIGATLPHDALPAETLRRAAAWLGGGEAESDPDGAALLRRLSVTDGFRRGLPDAGLDIVVFTQALADRLSAPGTDIIGALETGILGECRGWAARRGGSGPPLELTILIDDEAVATCRTGLYRPDIAADSPDAGHSGFHCLFPIPPHLLARRTLTLRVIEHETGRQIGPVHRLGGIGGLAQQAARLQARIPLILHDAWSRLTPPPEPPEIAGGVSLILTGDADAEAARAALMAQGGEGEIIPAADSIQEALEQARFETVIIQATAIAWAPGALSWLIWAAQTAGAMIYCDADHDSGEGDNAARPAPGWKPDFDYDLLLQAALPGAAIALPRKLAREAGAPDHAGPGALQDIALRVWEARGDDGVRHLPLMLAHIGGERPACDTPTQIVQDHIRRRGLIADVTPAKDGYTGSALTGRIRINWRAAKSERVHVIIPTRDRTDDLKTCIDSLRATASAPDGLRITVIDNDSREAESRAYLASLAEYDGVRVVADSRSFNWSALNNRAAAECDAPILIFANNDIECLTGRWDAIVSGYLARPELGALGARLLFPDDRLQHAGITPGPGGGVVHDCEFDGVNFDLPRSALTCLDHACLGVTGAFLACRRDDFERLGGFDERFAVSCNDLDFCLRLKSEGLKTLYTPALTLRHAGSSTRGPDLAAPETLAQGRAEFERLIEKHGADAITDPAGNPNFAGLPPRTLVTPLDRQRVMDEVTRPRRVGNSAPKDDRNHP